MREFRLKGRLDDAPKTSYSQAGTAVISFEVKVSEKRAEHWEVFHFKVVYYGYAATQVAQIMHKDSLVRVDGRMEARKNNVELVATSVDVVMERPPVKT